MSPSTIDALKLLANFLTPVVGMFMAGLMAKWSADQKRQNRQQQFEFERRIKLDEERSAELKQVALKAEETSRTAKKAGDDATRAAKEVAINAEMNTLAANQVALAAATVKTTLETATSQNDQKLDDLAKGQADAMIVLKATHTLCNSAMLEKDRLVAISARALADHSKTPEHIAAADEAERIYLDHKLRQAEVDAQPGTAAQKRGDP